GGSAAALTSCGPAIRPAPAKPVPPTVTPRAPRNLRRSTGVGWSIGVSLKVLLRWTAKARRPDNLFYHAAVSRAMGRKGYIGGWGAVRGEADRCRSASARSPWLVGALLPRSGTARC